MPNSDENNQANEIGGENRPFVRSPHKLRVGLLFLIAALVVWMIPQAAEYSLTFGEQATKKYIFDFDEGALLVAHIIMLSLLSVGITTIFVSMFGATVLIDAPPSIIGKGSLKIGNAAGFLAIVFGALYFATDDIHKDRLENLSSTIVALETQLKIEESNRKRLESFETFFDFISSNSNHVTGFTIETQIGRKSELGSIRPSNFFNVSTIDRDTLSALMKSGEKLNTNNGNQSYPISKEKLELYLYDVDREKLISEVRIQVVKGLGLKVELLVSDEICIGTTFAAKAGNSNSSILNTPLTRGLEGPVSHEKDS